MGRRFLIGLTLAMTAGACRSADPDAAPVDGQITVDDQSDPMLDGSVSVGEERLEQTPDLPKLPGEGPLTDYRLRLVNTLDTEVYVFGRAGAGRVALDTVAAGDSTRVDLRVRADEINLDAEDTTGEVVQSEVFVLTTDTLNRWVIEPGGRRPTVRDSASGSLVAPDTAGYPRTQP